MKGIVVYYSGTGSTQKIAKAIHKGMKEVLDECDIASIKKIDPKEMDKYDVIAIGGPIWYYRETANLRLFIYNMPKMEGKLVIPFCSHGSSPQGFFFSMVPALLKKGLTVIGWGDWYGSVFQVLHMPKPYLTDGHPDDIDLKEAEEFGREMGDRANKINAGQKELIPEIPRGKNADPLWKVHSFKIPKEMADKMDMPPMPPPPIRSVNTEKCVYPECTMCADNCPVNAFDFSKTPPKVNQNCPQCALCEKLCAYDAIELDGQGHQLPTQRKINMDKCKYPECTICLDNCPMDSIDFSQNPPAFKKNCEKDDLCWIICPEGAIEISNLEETHGRMQMKRDQVHGFHIMLDEAEKAGKFRRLVSLDDVGYDNPIWKMKQTPRFDIRDLKDDE